MADFCTFDSSLTTFDSSERTFDQTTCQEVSPPQASPGVQGGGHSRKKIRAKKRYRSLEPSEQEVIVALAAEQVAVPVQEDERLEQLTRALGPITLSAEHLAALEAERERLIGIEVGKYLRRLQDMEDEALVMAIAEAL